MEAAASADTPSTEDSCTSADTPTDSSIPNHFKPWLFAQLRQFGAVGNNRGSFYTTELDFGFGLPLGTPHLSLVIGASFVGGAYRDVNTRDMSGYISLGVFVDTRLRLNVRSPVRVFLATGARFNIGGPLGHVSESGEEEDDCPSLANVEASFGLGAELNLGRQGLLSFSVRGARRRSIGDYSFAANGTNPPVEATRGIWGVVAAIEIGAYFD